MDRLVFVRPLPQQRGATAGNPSAMATVEVKYLTQPHDGTPGTPWDDFEERILGVASGKTDERDMFLKVSQSSSEFIMVPHRSSQYT